MIWIFRNAPRGFESLSQAELLSMGAEKQSERFFFINDAFPLQKSAYAAFTVREVSRGTSAFEAIERFNEPVPQPYRVEKLKGTRRKGSKSYAFHAEKVLGGEIRASDPEAIISVFSPSPGVWIAGFLKEKKNSIVEKLEKLSERTSVSLAPHAAVGIANLVQQEPILDPCCGTGLLPFASMLLGKKTLAADNNYRMIRMAMVNRYELGLEKLEILKRDALTPWIKGYWLISDFPAERSWVSSIPDIAVKLL